MEKLIKRYKEECDLSSKLASRLWKLGQIIVLFVAANYYIVNTNILLSFLIVTICIIILHIICECIETICIAKKMNIKYNVRKIILTKKNRKNIYQQFDKYQKEWITNFCKKNKINNIEKLKIIREELSKKNNIIKYIDPIVIGTLLLALWEILLQNILEIIGLAYRILIGLFLVIIISIILGWMKKEWKEQKEFMNIFNRYSGSERLRDLLLYRILKS